MNKGLTITLISLLTLLLFFLVGVMIFLFNGKINFEGFTIASGYSKKLIEEKEINNNLNINVKTDVADVIVEEKDINNIKVELYSEKEAKHEITESTDSINIVLKQKVKLQFGLFNKSPRVVVYVPRTFNKNLKVNATTGDVKVGNLPNSDLYVKATTGDIKAKKLRNADLTVTTGDVKIDDVNTIKSETGTGDYKINNAKKISVVTNTGDIKVLNSVDEFTATTNTGDIKIGNVNKSINAVTNTGDVKINKATILVNSNIKTGTGDVSIGFISGCYVDGNTKIGDKNINNSTEDRKSDIILKINSRVGDIDVN